ncbi:hypothetical protein BN1723_009984 [Verticillium longisporum]|uniref:ABC transporter domain-containing protein n=1 Tax=Verticillium longisporum TaxID=100787 RepID=A0A0G4KUC0_VERLO|nr:hypothetical protein BN1723_009984 [Verticillium longisporum]
MGFAQCGWPIWQVDDVSLCFQQDFLKSLFPFITIAVSFLVLLFPYAWRAASHISLRKRGYEPLANAADDHANTAANHTDLPPDELEDSDDNDEPLTMNRSGGGRLSLVKTTTRGSVISIVQADSPHAQKLSVFVEEAAIIGLVAIYIIAIVTGGYGEKGKLSAVAGLVAWLYVFAIATLRLTLTSTQWRVPATLWNHTASIYGCQWLFTTFIFRSVLIHPSSRLIQILVIVEFALTTFLFVMAISTRKGNKTVLLEWEDGVEPSREPLASLLSLATFSWIDPMIWRGYKETIEMKAVWNLVPQEKAAAVLADYRTLKRTTSLAMHLLKYFKGELIFQCFLAFIGGVFTFALDPFDMYADEQIFEALRKVQLIGPSESLTRPQTPAASSLNPGTPTISVSSDGAPARSPTASIAPANKNVFLDLSSPVSESGSNLSQGQRQLLCLARAILKNPTVLVMDEATASIDYATDSKIQETIRELTSTIITIAHRLQTIVDYDKVLVLDKGSVVEYGHPYELIRKDKGSFRSMCDMSGELDLLIKAAKKKWDSGRLVDVDEEEQ